MECEDGISFHPLVLIVNISMIVEVGKGYLLLDLFGPLKAFLDSRSLADALLTIIIASVID